MIFPYVIENTVYVFLEVKMTEAEVITMKRRQLSLPVNLSTHLPDDKLEVDVFALEAAMDKYCGRVLKEILLGERGAHVSIGKNYFNHYSNNYPEPRIYSKVSKKYFGKNLKPSVMSYASVTELMADVARMYQLSYFHYILGRSNRMKRSFPSYCCGISSRNLILSLWEYGIVASTLVDNPWYDHAYLITPFTINNLGKNGVVLLDPTSDQLTQDPDKKIRNNIKIFPERDWEYGGDWVGGANLYPTIVQISACYGREDVRYEGYFEKAFQNPVVVKCAK